MKVIVDEKPWQPTQYKIVHALAIGLCNCPKNKGVQMYIFDTNPIYYLGDLYLTNTRRYNDLLAAVHSKRTKIGYTPIAIMEIVSRIYDEPQEFIRLQKGIDFLLKTNATHFPDFELVMSEIVTKKRIPKSQYDFWREVMVTIQNAPDPISLQNGFDDLKTFTEK